MIEDFVSEVEASIASGEPERAQIALVAKFKERGLSQRDAYYALESLRAGADDAKEELLLNVMDVVSGYCTPDRWIWSRRLSDGS